MNRLPPAPATDIDALIWWEVSLYRFGKGSPYAARHLVGRDTDGRDADLMHAAQLARHRTFPVDMPPLRIRAAGGVVIDCGGHLWDLDPAHRHEI